MRIKLSKNLLLGAFIVFCLLFVVINPYFYRITNAFFSMVAYPFLAAQSYCINPIKNYFISKNELIQKCQSLEHNYQELLQDYIELRSTENFIDDINEVLEFKNRYDYQNAILSRVIFRKINKFEHFVLVNKGSRHGIENDMVGLSKHHVIGRVTEVFPFYSKLSLITDKNSKVSVVSEKNKTVGILIGNNSNLLKLDHVIHLSSLDVGELLMSTGDGFIYPKGFILGQIVNVNANDVCKFAEVKPAIDLTSLDYIYLTNKGNY